MKVVREKEFVAGGVRKKISFFEDGTSKTEIIPDPASKMQKSASIKQEPVEVKSEPEPKPELEQKTIMFQDSEEVELPNPEELDEPEKSPKDIIRNIRRGRPKAVKVEEKSDEE